MKLSNPGEVLDRETAVGEHSYARSLTEDAATNWIGAPRDVKARIAFVSAHVIEIAAFDRAVISIFEDPDMTYSRKASEVMVLTLLPQEERIDHFNQLLGSNLAVSSLPPESLIEMIEDGLLGTDGGSKYETANEIFSMYRHDFQRVIDHAMQTIG